MTQPSHNPGTLDPRVLAAVVAAVQAYLEQEASAASPQPSRTLNAWKLAAWRMVRGADAHHLSWRGR